MSIFGIWENATGRTEAEVLELIGADPAALETQANVWLAARGVGLAVMQAEIAGCGDGLNFKLSIVAADPYQIDDSPLTYALEMGDPLDAGGPAIPPASITTVRLWSASDAVNLQAKLTDIMDGYVVPFEVRSIDMAGSSQGNVFMGMMLVVPLPPN